MKKILAVLLVAVLALSFAACGDDEVSNRSTVDVDAMDEQERQLYNELVSAYTVKKLSESRTLRVTYKEK